jgi:hypothetical protein
MYAREQWFASRCALEKSQKTTLVYSEATVYGWPNMGHHLVDRSTSGPAENPIPGYSRVSGAPSGFYNSGDRIAVPPDAVRLLRESIAARKEGAAVNEQIRAAAALICEEAHRTDAMPENVLVSIKELCHSLPEYEAIRGAKERDAFVSVVVTLVIEEYYRV